MNALVVAAVFCIAFVAGAIGFEMGENRVTKACDDYGAYVAEFEHKGIRYLCRREGR